MPTSCCYEVLVGNMGLYEVFGLIDTYLGKAYLYRYYYVSKNKMVSIVSVYGDTKIDKLQVLQTHICNLPNDFAVEKA
jgi:hypothetical protein